MRPPRARTAWSARHRNLPIKLFFVVILIGLGFMHFLLLFNAMALLEML